MDGIIILFVYFAMLVIDWVHQDRYDRLSGSYIVGKHFNGKVGFANRKVKR